jgi:hypothetical protein
MAIVRPGRLAAPAGRPLPCPASLGRIWGRPRSLGEGPTAASFLSREEGRPLAVRGRKAPTRLRRSALPGPDQAVERPRPAWSVRTSRDHPGRPGPFWPPRGPFRSRAPIGALIPDVEPPPSACRQGRRAQGPTAGCSPARFNSGAAREDERRDKRRWDLRDARGPVFSEPMNSSPVVIDAVHTLVWSRPQARNDKAYPGALRRPAGRPWPFSPRFVPRSGACDEAARLTPARAGMRTFSEHRTSPNGP